MKKSPLESKRMKTNLKNNLCLVLTNEDMLNVQATNVAKNSIMDIQEKYQCEPIQVASRDGEVRNQLTKDQSSYLVLTDTEMFLKKDLSEEPIDLNPWCKEWTTSCLDEELLSSNLDVQHMFCIDHFTNLQTLQDPRSSTELSTSQPTTAIFEHKSIPKDDIIYDFDQHIYSISHDNENNNVLSPTFINNDIEEMDLSRQVNDSKTWESEMQNVEIIPNDKLDSASFYLNKFETEQNNEESPNPTLILSPAESDIFFDTYTVVDPMDNFHSLNNRSDTTIENLESPDLNNPSDEVFVEQSIDLSFISNDILESDKLETITASDNCLLSRFSLIDSSKPLLNIKLVPESSDCLVNTPDVIDNAMSLESDFNLLSYIDNDTTSISSVSSDATKHVPVNNFCAIKANNKKSKHRHNLSIESHLSTTLKAKKKQEKRGRPPKLPGSSIKVEFFPGETEDDFKYRELRNKNNEASRRSRMLRKERETQILTTLHDLEKHNQQLINSVSHLEEECKKYRSKLLDAMSK